jgi:hypothetical protein
MTPFDDDSDQQPMQEQLSEPTSNTSADEDEVVCEQVQLSLCKPIIRPWEEIKDNKHRTSIGYEKEVTFHIPDYTKPIQFQSVGFLQESLYSPAPVQDKIPKCQHCHQVGHMEDQCFDLHPCEHCGKHNYLSDKCSKRKKPARVKDHYGWITSWQWSSTAKKIYRSYRRIHSHLVPNREVISVIDNQASNFNALSIEQEHVSQSQSHIPST